ncbi:protein NO VEIN domain-containing protein [Levilactobacillus brevis]|uniref:protein NO VEIN domain-containing protein n=1 Tax=Levilactobacillus brevis TaxID=1580 RepID=UPI001CDB3888|nr:DUF3883 domain-containing protein [Levilactobacillus brevis]
MVSLRDGTLDVGHDVPFLCAWLLIRIGHHGLFGLFNYVLHLDCKRGFYISQNERQYAKEDNSSYWLYRVYDINKEAKLEKYHGNLEQYFSFEPTDYLALKKEN